MRTAWDRENNPEVDLDAVVERCCHDLQTKADQGVSDLDRQRAEYEEASRDLRDFRQRHRLSRVAHYPSNPLAHWLWIPAAMIVESFAGANLLGSVSRGGVIEGWMVAVVLTFVNVLLGIWVGQAWRFARWGGGVVRLFAVAQSALGTILMLAWNNVAGHVRDVYVLAESTGALEAPDEAFATAWHTMMERPLPWDSLPSSGLALVGVAVFVLTAYKMYTADDPFPGYGERHRKVEFLHGRYQDDLNEALDELESARNEANMEISEIKDRYEMDRAGWESAHDRLRTVVGDYSLNLRQYNHDLAYLLAAYRGANLAARTAAPPPFFDTEPSIDEDAVRPPEFSVPDAPEWGDIPAKANAGYARVKDIYGQLRKRYRMLDRVVDDYGDDAA